VSPSAVAAIAVQTAVVLAVGMVLPRLVGMRLPSARLRYWQALLAVTLALPLAARLALPDASQPLAVRGSLVVEVVAGAVPSDDGGATAPWLPITLAVVAVLLLARVGLGVAALGRLRREARPLEPLPESVRSAEGTVGTSALFLVSDRVSVPVTFGWQHPVVILPESFFELEPEGQEALAVHELLHVRRRHWPVALAEELLKAALWFHPWVRILLGRVELAREQVVDADVVRATGRRRSYLEGLWHMAPRASGASPAPAIALLNRGHLRQRVALLTQEVVMSRAHVVIAVFVAGIVVGAAAVVAAGMFPAAVGSPMSNAYVPGLSPSFSPADTGGRGEGTARDSEKPIRYETDGPITEPRAIHKPNPKYPEEARKAGVTGVVVIDAEISAEGRVVNMKVLRTADEVFVQPTLDALSQWEFEPATLDGKPVAVYYVLTVRYALSDGPKDGKKSDG